MREHDLTISGPMTGKRRSTGHLLSAVQPQQRWQIDLIGRARAIWWVDQVRSATSSGTFAEFWVLNGSSWPKPFLNSMSAHASTREYVLRGAHELERVERHQNRKWNRDAIILHDAVSDLEVTHEWVPGVVINRLAAVRDKTGKVLIIWL